MKIMMDLDGVNIIFSRSLQSYLETIDHPCEYADPLAWDFYKTWNMNSDDFKRHCDDAADAGILFTGAPVEGAVEAWRKLRAAGHEIHVITDRQFGSDPRNSHAITYNWLAVNGFEYDSITFSADKLAVPTDVGLEDKIENYDALEAGGVKAYLVDRAWNSELTYPGARRRVSGVTEFAEIICAM